MGKTQAVGFGANYNHNMGPSRRDILTHRNNNATDDEEEDEEEEHDVPCFLLEDTPWGNNDSSEDLIQVATSTSSSFFLSSSGKVYSCGTLHGNIRPKLTQTVIQLPLKCVEIAAGRHFGLARMEGGLAVCSWGAGHFGQLALGADSPPYMEHPKVIESLLPHVVGAPISAIAAGYWHGMAVTQAGAVYSWGCNRNGQCGFKATKNPPTLCSPQLVNFDKKEQPAIVKVAAGRSHSVALDKEGKLYCWGACQYGQCGVITRRRASVVTPKQVESLSQVNIVEIAAGDSHTLALTGGGRVFAFGSGFEGQLGLGVIVQMNPKPKLVGDLDFVAIAAGREWKSQQQLQQQRQVDESAPDAPLDMSPTPSATDNERHPSGLALSQIPKIVSVHATGNSSMALSSTGYLYVWGCNDVGNLGIPKQRSNMLPIAEPSIPPVPKTTLRQLHSQSFDSSHNVGLPIRVDALANMKICCVAASPTFMWCLGTSRTEEDKNPNSIGLTLYELQEERRQKSLRNLHNRLNRLSFTKKPHSTSTTQSEAKSDHPLDPPEMKDGSNVDITKRKQKDSVTAAENDSNSSPGHFNHNAQNPNIPTDGKQDAVPPKPVKAKRRFSIPKAIGKIVRRASMGKTTHGTEG